MAEEQLELADAAAVALTAQMADFRAGAAPDALRALDNAIMLDRLRWMRQAGITFQGKRDTYAVLGYPRILTVRDFRDRYARGGIAGRIIDAIRDATWRGSMFVSENDEDADPSPNTEFEKAAADLDRRLQLQAKLLKVDKLAGLSTYAILLLGAPGDDLAQELPKAKGPDDLFYVTAFVGGGGPGGSAESRTIASDADATIYEFDSDPRSPRFGQPASYRLKRIDVSSPMLAKPVHWSRVIHVAEGTLYDEVYGQPAMERVWNLLDDLDKVTGGGAEAFWLRANQGMHLNVDPQMSIPATKPGEKSELDKLQEQAELYGNQMTRWLRTRGVDVNPLGSDVANFGPQADAILKQIAGSKAMPARILTGSEMGELASSQDRDNWKDQINGRQTQHAGPNIVRKLFDRLIEYGYLPTPKAGPDAYYVHWPHIETMTETEKSAGAKQWADTVSGGQPVFTSAEIREKWYGMDPLTDEQLAEIEAAKPEPVAPAVKPAFPRAAEAELHLLEEAIEKNDTGTVDRLLGLSRPVPKPINKKVEYDADGRIIRIVKEA
jgi:hypothetical protein